MISFRAVPPCVRDCFVIFRGKRQNTHFNAFSSTASRSPGCMKTAILPLPDQEEEINTARQTTGATDLGKPGVKFREQVHKHGYVPPDDKKGGGISPASCKNSNDFRGSGASAAHHEGSQANQAEGCRSRFRNGSRLNGAKVGCLGSGGVQRLIVHDKVFDVILAIGE